MSETINPVPFPDKSVHPTSISSRLRHRYKRKCQVWKQAVSMLAAANALAEGSVKFQQHTRAPKFALNLKVREAQLLAQQQVLSDACRLAKARRGLHDPTGVQSISDLTKTSMHDENGYSKRSTAQHAQVELIASAVAEPADDHSLCMLAALPPEERYYYTHESNVVNFTGKTSIEFKAIEDQYTFVGGALQQYLDYLHRPDLPHDMWEWAPTSKVRAYAGFTVVPKKDPSKQRKLLMVCAANYAWEDVRSRCDHGLHGGSAILKAVIPSDHMNCASFDEDNAFTRVKVPSWCKAWQAAPPVLAAQVWSLLPAHVQAVTEPWQYVAPLYGRMVMGSSHSVHILMMINIYAIGKCILSSSMIEQMVGSSFEEPQQQHDEPSLHYGCTDAEWVSRQVVRRGFTLKYSGYTVLGWIKEVRMARQSAVRVFIVANLFAGERRVEDVESCMHEQAKLNDLPLLFLSADLTNDSDWDLARPETYVLLLELGEQGGIDIAIAGPPCSTVSKARFNRACPGPRPLRFRGEHFWGRPDMRPHEKARVVEANTLYVHTMSLMEAVSLRGGSHLWEHPADPEAFPYPSIFATEEFQHFEARTSAIRSTFHQCELGGPNPKLTTFSGTLDGIQDMMV